MSIISKIKHQLYLLIAFTLPLNKPIVPLLIAFTLLLWLIEGGFVQKFKRLNTINFYISISLYVLLMIGLGYTENKAAGGFDIEQKMSLIIFPLLFFSEKLLTDEFVFTIKRVFVIGSILSLILCLINSSLHYYYSYMIDSFFYVQFSSIMHPSYYGMYLSFAIAILLFDKEILFRTFYKIPASLFLSVGVVLSSSKSAIITLVIIFAVKVLHKFFVKKNVVSSLILLSSVVLSFLAVFIFLPQALNRIKDMKQTLQSNEQTLNTTSSRIAIWKHAISIIKDSPIIGYGTGDVNDVLQKTYNAENEQDMKDRKFNAHNQYLQTTLAVGVLGLILLVIPFIFLFINSYHQKTIVPQLFVLIILVNMLFEAMFETQAGIVFISFFLFLFLKFYHPTKVNA